MGEEEMKDDLRQSQKHKQHANNISSMQITQANHLRVSGVYKANETLLVSEWGCRGKTLFSLSRRS